MSTEIDSALSTINGALQSLAAHNERLEEHVNDIVSRANDAFWQPLNYTTDEGIDLAKLKELSGRLRDVTTAGSLHVRAVQLTHAYVFSRGMIIDGESERVRKAIEHPYNQAAIFSQRAQEELTKAMYTDGQVFVLRNTTTRVLTRVPLSQIEAFNVDSDSPERIWHIKRTWYDGSKRREKWYPTSMYVKATPKSKLQKTINESGRRVAVDNSQVVHMSSVGRQIGWALGLPVGLPAMQWVETYTKYLQNSAALVEAYSKIAFKFSQKASQTIATGAAIAQTPSNAVGGVASMGLADSLTAMPATGSQVSFANGRPIAALAASAVGVSVVALLSDPGAAGSSYGAAQTLDSPTVRVMTVWQDSWVAFYREILEGMGANLDELTVTFPAIETDVPYRQLTSLAQAYTTGAIHQEEYRAGVLSILDIPNPSAVDDLPVPDQFNMAHAIPFETEEEQADANKVEPETDEETLNDPLARQGNSGAVGSTEHDSNFNRQADAGRA